MKFRGNENRGWSLGDDMPLIIEGTSSESLGGERNGSRAVVSIDRYVKRAECVSLALINNMPDAALEDTELQFFELLDIASGDVPVLLKLYSLTGVPRTDRGQRHLNDFYFGLDELWNSRFDGVIITGTEPRQPDLRQEPYWSALANVLDWAERNTRFDGSVLSGCTRRCSSQRWNPAPSSE